MAVDPLKNQKFKSIDELKFFISENKNGNVITELMESSEEFRQNLQFILEQEIIGNKVVNNSSIVEIASAFDKTQLRDPLTNALMVGGAFGLNFFNFCHDFLKERIKNPFIKIDAEYVKKAKLIREMEEEEELEQEISKKVKLEKEKDLSNEKQNHMKIIMHKTVLEQTKLMIASMTNTLMASRELSKIMFESLTEKGKQLCLYLMDYNKKFRNSPMFKDMSNENFNSMNELSSTVVSTISDMINDPTKTKEEVLDFLKESKFLANYAKEKGISVENMYDIFASGDPEQIAKFNEDMMKEMFKSSKNMKLFMNDAEKAITELKKKGINVDNLEKAWDNLKETFRKDVKVIEEKTNSITKDQVQNLKEDKKMSDKINNIDEEKLKSDKSMVSVDFSKMLSKGKEDKELFEKENIEIDNNIKHKM